MAKIYLSSFLIFISNLIFAQWQTDTRLTNATDESVYPAIAAAGLGLHVVWNDYRDGNNEIYYKSSNNGGKTWGTDMRLTNAAGSSYYPSVAVSGSTIHVAWQDKRDGNDEIYYNRSTDGGITWGTDMRLTTNIETSSNPYIAVSGSVVHIVWYDARDGNNEIYYKRSTDGGQTWGADSRLTNNTATSLNASIAVSGSTVLVFWNDNRDLNNEIYSKRSTDGGQTWGTDNRITNESANSDYPMVAISGLNVHLVWRDYRDANFEIYYKRSKDAGLSWDADKRLTSDPAVSSNPTVTAAGAVAHVFWEDLRDGNNEIYHKQSTDTGSTWAADERLTNNASNSKKPAAIVSGTGLNLVWYDDRDGNNEIYFKRDSSLRITGIKEYSFGGNNTKVFPNPVSSALEVSSPGMGSGILSIYNVLGEQVLQNDFKANNFKVDVSGLKSGIYFIRINSDDKPTENIKFEVIH
jgi:hypothetical protein